MTTTEERAIRIYETYYSYNVEKDLKAFTEDLWNPSKTVWVRVSDPESARYGSIGIAVPWGLSHDDRTKWHQRPKKDSRYYYREPLVDKAVNVYFHDKGVKMAVTKKGFEWLPDYTGEKVFKFESKEQKPKYTFTDIMGDVIELGDFVSFTNGWGEMSFGHVTKISKVGMIYVTNMKTKKRPGSYEIRLKNGDQCCRMTKDIFNRLMLMKLELA